MRMYIRVFIVVIGVFGIYNLVFGAEQFDLDKWKKGQNEREISRTLCRMTISWVCDGNEAAGIECDRLSDSLLKLSDPSIKAYFISAQVAALRQQPDKATLILEEVIEKYPDQTAPIGIVIPVEVAGRFWISSIAKRSGNFSKAKNAYESLLKLLYSKEQTQDYCDNGGLIMICHLYLSELESEKFNNKAEALAHLNAIDTIRKPGDRGGVGYDLYKSWAAYRRTKLSVGNVEAVSQLKATSETMSAPMLASTQLALSELCGAPLLTYSSSSERNLMFLSKLINRIIETSIGSIDESLAKLVWADSCQQRKLIDEAITNYTSLFQDNSFFSPIAGISLAQIHRNKGDIAGADEMLKQVRNKYPGYDSFVTQVRQSWEK